MCIRDRNINSAVSYYEKALSIDSDNTDVRFALADIYMSKKDYDAALVLYQEIINIDPKSKEAYKQLISIDVYKRQACHLIQKLMAVKTR